MMSGWLQKRGERGLQFYKRRYFVLRDADLYYGNDDSMQSLLNPLGKIDVGSLEKVVLVPDVASLFGPPSHFVYLYAQRRIYDLCTDSREDAVNWAKCIEEARVCAQAKMAEADSATFEPASDQLPIIVRSGADVLFDHADIDDDDEMPPLPPTTRSTSAASVSSSWASPRLSTQRPPSPAVTSPTTTPSTRSNSADKRGPSSPVVVPTAASANAPAVAPVSEYLAVPIELRRMFIFTENYAFGEYFRSLEPAILAAHEHARTTMSDTAKASRGELASLFAAALVVRALGMDLLQYSDAAPAATAAINETVLRHYAALHELLLGRLQLLDSRLAGDTAALDRWLVTHRQPQLFANASTAPTGLVTSGATSRLELPLFDRMGLLRWHVLLLCDYATRYWEPVRATLVVPKRVSGDADVSLTRVLYMWDVCVDCVVRELGRLPAAACGVHLWQLLVDSPAYQVSVAMMTCSHRLFRFIRSVTRVKPRRQQCQMRRNLQQQRQQRQRIYRHQQHLHRHCHAVATTPTRHSCSKPERNSERS
jgi:hypothetical protein